MLLAIHFLFFCKEYNFKKNLTVLSFLLDNIFIVLSKCFAYSYLQKWRFAHVFLKPAKFVVMPISPSSVKAGCCVDYN